MPFCTMCDVPVFSRSKHCRACSKCVDVFDHHCMWLNNCVGGQNYRAFFVTVSAVAAMIGIILCTCLYLLVDVFTNTTEFERRIRDVAFMEILPMEFFMALLVAMICVNGPLFLLDFQLVILHIFLSSQQLTTYEYIMSKRGQMEGEEGDASAIGESPKDEAGAGQPERKAVRTLPHWMDWIIFSRCGRRRRPKLKKTTVEQIGSLEDTDPEGEGQGQARLPSKR